MPHILLTGAGFSRNWGGWLADEAFEYLLGSEYIDDGIRRLLWDHKSQGGGFEGALAQLQESATQRSNLEKLENAVLQMFNNMNRALVKTKFEFHEGKEYSIGRYLGKFDAIFTLNQDLLIEQHYINGNYLHDSDSRWERCETPGIERIFDGGTEPIDLQWWSPMDDPKRFSVEKNVQPYFKLHGSSGWFDMVNGQRVLVIGGNKASTINRFPILKWNYERFTEYLSKPDTLLMVIGYSFGDDHINNALGEAAGRETLRLFIIDPQGVDVLNKDRIALSLFPGSPFALMQSCLIGASRRPLSAIFGGDMVEHGKVMRFFD